MHNLFQKIFSSALWFKTRSKKKIYLTFDDGPIPGITPWVLQTLKQYNAKATFFCVGQNVEKYSEIYMQILKENHTVGNHTHHHLHGWKTNNKSYYNDIEICSLKVKSKLFRPPYGKLKFTQYKKIKQNYTVVMWDVLSGDYNKKISKKKCLSNVIKQTKEGSIIVFHDSIKAQQSMQYALPKVLEYFTNKGFEFCSLTN